MLLREILKNIAAGYLKIVNRAEYINVENVPKEGALVIYANHQSNADPFLVCAPIKRVIYYMGKEELFRTKFTNWLFRAVGTFPIKRGKRDISAIKTSLEILGRGDALGMFPEGTRKKAGKETKAKPGIAMIAIKAKCPVVPVAIVGVPSGFNKVKVVYGKPIDLSEYYEKELHTSDYNEISEKLMLEIEKLKGEYQRCG